MEEEFKNIDMDRLEEMIQDQVDEGAEELIEEIMNKEKKRYDCFCVCSVLCGQQKFI